MKVGFRVAHQDKNSFARAGLIKTSRGLVKTPCYIPDATYGAVKLVSCKDLKNLGLQMLLANSYHLWLRPGVKYISQLGGLHQFMSWNQPILTDSGGWQVFSLVYKNKMGKVVKSGVRFKDHLSGQVHFLTPKKAIKNQLNLNSDILMVLDYPVCPNPNPKENQRSVKLTTSWARKSWATFLNDPRSKNKILMAIVQGASSQKLRKKSFQELERIHQFPGYGFGGPLPNDKPLAYLGKLIPEDRIRYVMGCGRPQDVVKAIGLGWDLFDCVIPTRNARHGLLYTFSGEIRITRKQYASDTKPIEKNCPCEACQNHTRQYVRHLLKVKEPLGARLASIHNLTFYMRLLKRSRQMIKKDSFKQFLKKIVKVYET